MATVESVLKTFASVETIENVNSEDCCGGGEKGKGPITLETSITSTPNVLIVHLKRYIYDETGYVKCSAIPILLIFVL
jgi:hypothetical protein